MRLSAIHLHPVKSTAVRPVRQAALHRSGLEGDREWVVVDGDGVMVTAREARSLLRVVADTPATDPEVAGALRLRGPGMPELTLDTPPPGAGHLPVRVFSSDLRGVPVGPEADAWLRRALARDDVRLLWCDDPSRRRLNPSWARPTDHSAFPDSAPLSVVSTASLDRLQDWLRATAAELGEPTPAPMPVTRFRPNLVVDGLGAAFDEDGWRRVRIGDVDLRAPKRLDRCVITTVDPETLEAGPEPIRTLARHRREAGKTWFGMRLVPDGEGVLSVGDPVTVVETAPADPGAG